MWQYSDGNAAPIHRQWMLFPLTASQQPSAIKELTTSAAASPSAASAYDLSGRRLDSRHQLPKGIYIIQGRKVVVR